MSRPAEPPAGDMPGPPALPETHPPRGRSLTRVRQTRGLRFLDLRELWTYRELLYFLTWRDIKVRYKQTAIGVLWALLQPVAMTLVFTLFFGELANIPSDGVPYAAFALAALLPWQLFSRSVTESTHSLVTDQKLISRVYFPRIIVPSAACLSALLDFGLALVPLLVLMGAYGLTPGLPLLLLPAFVGLMLLSALGVGFWLSALNLEYRDVSYALPFVVQLWLFLTPVVYPSSLVPSGWRSLYALNPMVGVVDGFRWSLLGTPAPSAAQLTISAVVGALLFVSGAAWFRQRERTFVDAIGSGGR